MGERVSDTTTVDAPLPEVMAVITDLARYPEWTEGVTAVEVLDTDTEGRPARARFTIDARVMELRYVARYRYTPSSVRWELEEGETVTQLDGSYDLDERGTQTGVRYTLEADIAVPLPGFMKKRAAKQVLDQGLAGLKRRVETGRA